MCDSLFVCAGQSILDGRRTPTKEEIHAPTSRQRKIGSVRHGALDYPHGRGTDNPVTLKEAVKRGWENLHFRFETLTASKPTSSIPEEPQLSDSGNVHRIDANAGPEQEAARDIAEVPAIEVINTVAVHLLSAAAVKCGLADDPEGQLDLDEARKLITALAGLVTAAAPDLGDQHARALRDGLRSVQLAFREASPIPDPPGSGPGEKYTGAVS